LSGRFDGGQNFGSVPFGRHVVPDLANFSLRANPVRHAHDSKERFSQEALHAPRAEGFHHLKFRVGEQREIQLVLDAEFRLVFDAVRAATEDAGVGRFKLLDGVTKLGRFRRSTGSIRFGEEEEDEVLPLVVLERNGLALIGSD
jgi:hypothetical protein